MSIQKPEFVFFYAWQSDRPSSKNRYFIQEALTAAADALNSEADCPYSIRIDQDTQGVPGLCDIPATILSKIDAVDGFVCDLTYVAQSVADQDTDATFRTRYCSNPNVLFELGFAFRSLGPERIVCVMNESFGPVTEQIFDLAHRRFPVSYRLPHDEKTNRQVSAELIPKLVAALKSVLPLGRRTDSTSRNRIAATRESFESSVKDRQFHGILRRRGAIAITVISPARVSIPIDSLNYQYIPVPSQSTGGGDQLNRGNSKIALWAPNGERYGITEVRSDGVILGVDTFVLDPEVHPPKKLLVPSDATMDLIVSTTTSYFELLRKLSIPMPWTVCISLLDVKDYWLIFSNVDHSRTKFPDDDILCEPIEISNLGEGLNKQFVAQQLRPAIDYIWREFGFESSPYYIAGGVCNRRF